MTRDELIALCLKGRAAGTDMPFGPEGSIVVRHTANGKWFALVFILQGKLCINLKCSPIKAEFWRSVYQGVQPAWHMNKTHWNKIEMETDVPLAELCEMIADSYHLTAPARRQKKKPL